MAHGPCPLFLLHRTIALKFILILWCGCVNHKVSSVSAFRAPKCSPGAACSSVACFCIGRKLSILINTDADGAAPLNLTYKRLFLLRLTRQITLSSHSGIIITHNFPFPLMTVGWRAETVESWFIQRAVTNLIACRVEA